MLNTKDIKAALRITDANLNRTLEGLRVCEDVVRFVLNEKTTQGRFKALRHKVKELKLVINKDFDITAARDSKRDVGKASKVSDMKRSCFIGVFAANAQRAKESLRTLEEVSKLFDPCVSEGFKDVRFRLYTLEKKVIKKFKIYESYR